MKSTAEPTHKAEAGLSSLDRIRASRRVEVLEVKGGREAARLLAQLDIRVGEILTVQRSAPLGGPILVENAGTTVAVGRGLARNVLVRVLP